MNDAGAASGSPDDPRADRFSGLSTALRWAGGAAMALAVATLVVGDRLGDIGEAVGWAMFAVVVLTPLARTGWFARRWWSRGDRRYAAVASGVLVVVAVGALLGLLTR